MNIVFAKYVWLFLLSVLAANTLFMTKVITMGEMLSAFLVFFVFGMICLNIERFALRIEARKIAARKRH